MMGLLGAALRYAAPKLAGEAAAYGGARWAGKMAGERFASGLASEAGQQALGRISPRLASAVATPTGQRVTSFVAGRQATQSIRGVSGTAPVSPTTKSTPWFESKALQTANPEADWRRIPDLSVPRGTGRWQLPGARTGQFIKGAATLGAMSMVGGDGSGGGAPSSTSPTSPSGGAAPTSTDLAAMASSGHQLTNVRSAMADDPYAAVAGAGSLEQRFGTYGSRNESFRGAQKALGSGGPSRSTNYIVDPQTGQVRWDI